ncbi:MAG: DUF3168 domain-containing protein [Beijerinckiaceae bacterium]|nr:DUF3168 domain-containing protein [Beijerinckiaceae bacterium]
MTTIHPVHALKAALRTRLITNSALTALIGTAVHDAPPRGAEPPFLLLGDAQLRENGTNEGDGVIVDLDLVAFTRERGTAGALAILHAVQAAMASAPLSVADHQLSLILIRETLVRHDEAKALTRATARLRAFLHIL